MFMFWEVAWNLWGNISAIITLNSRKQTVQQCATGNSQLPEFTKACPFQVSNSFEQYYWSPQLVGRICMFICINYTHVIIPSESSAEPANHHETI